MTNLEKIERRENIARDAATGCYSLKHLCLKYNVTYTTVYKSCREYGINWKDKNVGKGSPSTSWKILAFLLNTNLTCEEIGEEFNVTKQRVHQLLTKARDCGIRVRIYEKPN